MTGEKDAPAEMPGERELALAIKRAQMGDRAELSKEGPWLDFELRSARAALALFAPILAEKERTIQQQRDRADGYKRAYEASEAALAAEREKNAALSKQLEIALAGLQRISDMAPKAAAAIRSEGE